MKIGKYVLHHHYPFLQKIEKFYEDVESGKHKPSQKEEEYCKIKKFQILVEKNKAKKLTFDEAVNLAMEFTKKTNKEVDFRYNPETLEVISSIVIGSEFGVSPIPEEKNISAKASFHTHSKRRICEFSNKDLINNFKKMNMDEIKVGCYFTNEIITLKKEDINNTNMIKSINQLLNEKERLNIKTKEWKKSD